jgi:hypothetical protein
MPVKVAANYLLEILYAHSLPGIISVRAERFYIIEVGLLVLYLPSAFFFTEDKFKVLKYTKSACKDQTTKEADYAILPAIVNGKRQFALVPMNEFLNTGDRIISPYHRYFTRSLLEPEKLAQLMEEKRLKVNMELREKLAKQRRF